MKLYSKTLVGILSLMSVSFVQAQQITGTDILNLLVDNEVLTKEQAQTLVGEVRARQSMPEEADSITGEAIVALLVETGVIAEESAAQLMQKMEKRAQAVAAQELEDKANNEDSVRVPYIPKYVQQEMEQKLKFAVESDIVETVHEDVVRTARTEGWGIKEAPSWVYKIKLKGDGRVRYHGDFFPSDNALYAGADIGDINDNGTGDLRKIYNNVTDDRHRLRSRFRLMFEAKPFETVKLGMRLTTGNQGNPVSGNQTLGSFGEKWETSMDLGYIHYRAMEKDIELWGGRFKSPMLKTDLIFDNDMTFEGLAGSYYFLRNDTIYEDDHQWDPYLTVGVYPIQEIHQFIISETPNGNAGVDANLGFDNNDDKFLYALQLGTKYSFFNTNELAMGLSLYHYENINGKRNTVLDGDLQDVTASGYYQAGNTLMNIANSSTPGTERLALASDFSLLNATLTYRMANFYPTYVFLHADVVRNIAFDKDEIEARIGGTASVPERDTGYQVGVSIGTFTVKYLRDWRLSFTYRHLEGDAALDAFADSDFLLGGTDAEGFKIKAEYGLLDNVIAGLSYITADSIDTDPDDDQFNLSADSVFLDLSARF